jgi:hypothetical protein
MGSSMYAQHHNARDMSLLRARSRDACPDCFFVCVRPPPSLARSEIQASLQGRSYSFSIIVHTEGTGPLINFHAASPIVNVRADCPPSNLVQVRGGV